MNSKPSTAAFTLLEVVLAMTALALVAAICYAAFHLGIRAVERGEVAVVTAQRLRVASDVLIRQLKSAVVYTVPGEDAEPFPYFIGSATSLTFITAAGMSGGGGLVRVVYRLEGSPGQLVMEESPYFSPRLLGRDPLDQPAGRTTVLLDGVETLKFEYFYDEDQSGVSDPDQWHATWDGRGDEEAIPSVVRVKVTGPSLEGGFWGQEIPLMVAAASHADDANSPPDNALGEEDEEDEDEDVDEGVTPGPIQRTPAGGHGLRGTFPFDDDSYDE